MSGNREKAERPGVGIPPARSTSLGERPQVSIIDRPSGCTMGGPRHRAFPHAPMREGTSFWPRRHHTSGKDGSDQPVCHLEGPCSSPSSLASDARTGRASAGSHSSDLDGDSAPRLTAVLSAPAAASWSPRENVDPASPWPWPGDQPDRCGLVRREASPDGIASRYCLIKRPFTETRP